MELPEPTARNALRLLQYLSERERRREPELPETSAISEVIGLTLDDTNDLIDILEREWAIKETWTIDGVANPVLTGHGKLINHTSIQMNLPMKAVVRQVGISLCLPVLPNPHGTPSR